MSSRIRTYPEHTVETFYDGYNIHRVGAPAVIKKTHAGVVLSEYWFENNMKHRLGEPAAILRDGKRHSIAYYQYDKLHRLDGPAVIETVNGVVVLEQYYVDGRCHREDGPAHISRDEQSGRIIAAAYYRNGERC